MFSKVAYHKSPSLAGKLQAVTPTRVYDNEGKAIFEMNLRFFFVLYICFKLLRMLTRLCMKCRYLVDLLLL